MSRKRKGVFCLEIGEWYGVLKKKQSVEPALQLLNQCSNVPYIHRGIATEGELNHYIRKWTQAQHKDFPILYLAFHGRPGAIMAHNEIGRRIEISLDDIMTSLEDKCHRRIIHFGSCSALNIHGATMNRYLRMTGALAICGYSSEIDWLKSSTLDLLLFDTMQRSHFTKAGVRNIYTSIRHEMPTLCRELEFRMVAKK